MQTRARTTTVAEFRAFTELPENRDKDFELLEGEVIEVPSPKKIHALIVGRIFGLLFMFIEANQIRGTLVHDNLDHILGNDSILKPDVGFTSIEREPVVPDYPIVAPDLVVEVLSPSNTPAEILSKAQVFFAHGTRLMWVVYPEKKVVQVYAPGREPNKPHIDTFLAEDMITGGDVLPGFSVKVDKLFPTLPLADDVP